MNKSTVAIALIFTGSLAGCAAAVPVVDFYDSDSDTLRRFQTITVLDGASASSKDLTDLGEVKGIYCDKTYGQESVDDPITKAQAIDQVKLKAAEIGANYITTPQCIFSDSGDVANNCYSTLVCTALALKVSE